MSASGALELGRAVERTGVFPWWLVLIEGVAALTIGVLLLLALQATVEWVYLDAGPNFVGGLVAIVMACRMYNALTPADSPVDSVIDGRPAHLEVT